MHCTASSTLHTRALPDSTHACVQATRELGKYACEACRGPMAEPVSTPCGHHFCRSCLLASFERAAVTTSAARTFRARKQPKPCPRCRADLTDFARTMQPNLATAADIERLRSALATAQAALTRVKAAFEEVTDATGQPADAAAAVGWRVEVWWADEEAWFGGFVARAAEGAEVEVAYDDGDRQLHSLERVRFRWLRPTAPAGAPRRHGGCMRRPCDRCSLGLGHSPVHAACASFTCPDLAQGRRCAESEAKAVEEVGAAQVRCVLTCASAGSAACCRCSLHSATLHTSPGAPENLLVQAGLTDAQKGVLERADAARAAERGEQAAAAAQEAAAERDALVADFCAVADGATVDALLADQGGDALAVRAMLKRMRREHKVRRHPVQVSSTYVPHTRPS